MEYIPAKSIVNRAKNPGWFGAIYNMNIYRGCCHGCIYCDSRSDCYHNTDFDRVKAKADALRIIRDDLARRAKRGVVATGAAGGLPLRHCHCHQKRPDSPGHRHSFLHPADDACHLQDHHHHLR